MDPGKICEAAECCQRLFSSCIMSVPHREHNAPMCSAQGDFNLWCATIKATSVGKASLDYRLRDHTDVRDLVCNWLASLKVSLEQYHRGANDERESRTWHRLGNPTDAFPELDDEVVPEDHAAAPDSPLLPESPASWSSISNPRSGSDSSTRHDAPSVTDLAAAECISYIRTALDRLAWLSLTIRNAGSRYRFGKADEALDERAFMGFRAYLTGIILRGIPNTTAAYHSTTEIVDPMTDFDRLTAVQKQLLRANIVRRNRIECTVRDFGERTPSTAKVAKPPVDSRHNESIIMQPSITESNMSSSSRTSEKRTAGSTMTAKAAPIAPRTAARTAAGIESRLDVSRMPSGRASLAASNLTTVAATQTYPRFPKPNQDSLVECPYCLDVLPSSYSKSEDAWKAHVSRDILPYTCFIEGCSTPDEMYLTSETLLAHLVQEHSSLRWICDFCALSDEITGQPGVRREFYGAEEWKQHITEAHENRIQTLQEPQLAELAELNKRPMIGPLSCPLCDFTTPNISSKIDDHILQHIHEFSLRALPDIPEAGDADGSIASGATVKLSHITDIKPEATETGLSLVLPDPNPSTIHDHLAHILPSPIDPSLEDFLVWTRKGLWASPATASKEFWAAHFGKLQHIIKTYDEGVDDANMDITVAMSKDLVSQAFVDLLAWKAERNSSWFSSNSSQSQPTWRINLPPLKTSFIARDRDKPLTDFLETFLDELESVLFISRPRLGSFGLEHFWPQKETKPAEEEFHASLRSQRQSIHENIQPRIVLRGDRGVGKTAVAIELVHRIAVEHPNYSLFWVNATSTASIQKSYQHIWESVGQPQGPLYDSPRALVYYLNWEIRGPWLMVLDGIHAHTLQHMVFNNWIPSGLYGILLLNTRDTSGISMLGSAELVEMPHLPPLPSLPPLPYSPLWDKIAGARSSSEYPYKVEFWPERSLDKITGLEITIELYGNSTSQAGNAIDMGLVRFILIDATKLLAACYLSQIRHRNLEQTMGFFRNNGFSDSSLPFEEDVISQCAGHLPWDRIQMVSFLQYQWRFVAQRFTMDRPLLPGPLSTETILPFIRASPFGQGNFGTVYKVMVHPSHLDRDDPIQQTNCQVAIKEVILKDRNYESLQFGQDSLAEREKRALLRVLFLKDKDPESVKHIVDVKAIFDHGWKRYYMFPWADGGHLWNLWERHRVIQPQEEGKFVAGIVAQILGLAGALAALHRDNCRHGDLKPENILIFKIQDQADMWKIGDFGLAKYHDDSTQKRRGPTSIRHGTVSYESPEFLRDNLPTSRLYDMWSMGCIILQLITWLLYGIQGVRELTEKTRNHYRNDSTFWSQRWTGVDWSDTIVHEEVESHMEKIMRDSTGSEAIKDLLRVVRDKLLVTRLPSDIRKEWQQGYRANAETLHDDLMKISKKGESDPGYWFTTGTLFRKPADKKVSDYAIT